MSKDKNEREKQDKKISINAELHKRLKIEAAKTDKTLQGLVEEKLTEKSEAE